MKLLHLLPMALLASISVNAKYDPLYLIQLAKSEGQKGSALALYAFANKTNDPKLKLIVANLKAGNFVTQQELDDAIKGAAAPTSLPGPILKMAVEGKNPLGAAAEIIQTSGVDAFTAAGMTQAEAKNTAEACVKKIQSKGR